MTIGGWRERLGSLSVRREELDDKELVTRTLSGDLRSYEELVSRYERLVGRVVYPYARREISVEDLVQETFLRAYDRLETFQPRLPLQDVAARHRQQPRRGHPEAPQGDRRVQPRDPRSRLRAAPRPRPSTPTAPGASRRR